MWVSNGGSWCLTNSDPDWVLFKHHLLTIKLHKKYIYANVNKYTWHALGGKMWVTDLGLFKHQMKENNTQTYKESDT